MRTRLLCSCIIWVGDRGWEAPTANLSLPLISESTMLRTSYSWLFWVLQSWLHVRAHTHTHTHKPPHMQHPTAIYQKTKHSIRGSDFRDGQIWLLTRSSIDVSAIQDAMMNLYHLKTNYVPCLYLFKNPCVLLMLVPHNLSI